MQIIFFHILNTILKNKFISACPLPITDKHQSCSIGTVEWYQTRSTAHRSVFIYHVLTHWLYRGHCVIPFMLEPFASFSAMITYLNKYESYTIWSASYGAHRAITAAIGVIKSENPTRASECLRAFEMLYYLNPAWKETDLCKKHLRVATDRYQNHVRGESVKDIESVVLEIGFLGGMPEVDILISSLLQRCSIYGLRELDSALSALYPKWREDLTRQKPVIFAAQGMLLDAARAEHGLSILYILRPQESAPVVLDFLASHKNVHDPMFDLGCRTLAEIGNRESIGSMLEFYAEMFVQSELEARHIRAKIYARGQGPLTWRKAHKMFLGDTAKAKTYWDNTVRKAQPWRDDNELILERANEDERMRLQIYPESCFYQVVKHKAHKNLALCSKWFEEPCTLNYLAETQYSTRTKEYLGAMILMGTRKSIDRFMDFTQHPDVDVRMTCAILSAHLNFTEALFVLEKLASDTSDDVVEQVLITLYIVISKNLSVKPNKMAESMQNVVSSHLARDRVWRPAMYVLALLNVDMVNILSKFSMHFKKWVRVTLDQKNPQWPWFSNAPKSLSEEFATPSFVEETWRNDVEILTMFLERNRSIFEHYDQAIFAEILTFYEYFSTFQYEYHETNDGSVGEGWSAYAPLWWRDFAEVLRLYCSKNR